MTDKTVKSNAYMTVLCRKQLFRLMLKCTTEGEGSYMFCGYMNNYVMQSTYELKTFNKVNGTLNTANM